MEESVKRRGRPRKNQEDKIRHQLIALHKEDYLKLKSVSDATRRPMTQVLHTLINNYL